jgi:hypothetical protein
MFNQTFETYSAGSVNGNRLEMIFQTIFSGDFQKSRQGITDSPIKVKSQAHLIILTDGIYLCCEMPCLRVGFGENGGYRYG